jgi:hypothetical protein
MKTFPCSILRPARTQATRCGNTFTFVCFDFRVRLGTWQGSAPTIQPPPKSPQTTCYCNFLIQLYSAIATCNVLPDAGLQKRANFSTLIVGLAGTGNRTRATCVAGTGTNCSAIHYDSPELAFVSFSNLKGIYSL